MSEGLRTQLSPTRPGPEWAAVSLVSLDLEFPPEQVWHRPSQGPHLSLEGLVDVSAQRAPLVRLLQGLCGQLHPGLDLVDFHQHLEGKTGRRAGSGLAFLYLPPVT